jgi:UDP-glucose 4-epimerase
LTKTIVTGGAGFIGSHLVEQLIEDGHQVTVLDDYSSGRAINLDHLKENPGLEIHKVDVSNFEDIQALFSGVDWVFHLAGRADLVPSIQEPLIYLKANVDGTAAVVEASRQAGVKRLIYTASSSCYGLPDVFPTPESAPIRPMYPYALSKYLGENIAMHWDQVYGLPCVSLRLFNVYGPRSRTSGAYGAVFGVFLAQKLAEQPFTVVGDGTQTRDFTFVTDVVHAFIAAAQSDIHGEILNVGSGGTYSVNQLVGLIGGDTVHIPDRPGEPKCTLADIEKITSKLGWQPKIGIEEGVNTMLREIHYWSDAPVWNEQSISEATRDWFTYLGSSDKEPSGK